ncbi:Uma2 family endonuclease [Allorhizocola rhizosphaerae]|uniref:Uma2 family endonuclease n=1 Tax=Allorhizocola rhizosphaerae TaxID=1872709 RepID=UPI001B8C93AC|nr:Uma2 family endonuclease [Allorhizocola rhizosphaerae]
MSAETCWPEPPVGGYTAEDLDRLPDLPPHTELIDGSLVFVSPQKQFHTLALSLLDRRLGDLAPADRRVRREMSVFISNRQRPEPEIVVVRANVATNQEATWYPAEAVMLAIEVVSPDSAERDRYRKPQLYAEAKITHFWRVEDDNGEMVVHVYGLDPAREHTPSPAPTTTGSS